MTAGRRWLCVGLLVAVAFGWLSSLAAALERERALAPAVAAFDRFLAVSSPVCLHRPAAECVGVGWAFADADGDGALALGEIRRVRDTFAAWLELNRADLTSRERSLSSVGLWLIDAVGLERLHESYDADGDGLVGRGELLADVTLDERPLGEVLIDPDAVDRAAIADRVGGFLPLLQDRLP